MIRLLTAALLVASFNAVADDLRTFSDGQVINADDFNHNFQKLEQDIANGVTGPQGEQGPAGPQGEQGPAGPQGERGFEGPVGNNGPPGDKGDTGDQGPAGPQGEQGMVGLTGPQGEQGPQGMVGPAGADGVAAGLNCTTDQSIVYRGGAWVCSSPEFLASVPDAPEADLSCSIGKKVTGGGCGFYGLASCDSTQSRPEGDLSGWFCRATGSGGCLVYSIYAICQ